MPDTATPFTSFKFAVEISVPGLSDRLCQASFAECDGLEMTMQPKTIREGGNNAQPIHLAGGVGYGQLTLKRGMTEDFSLWTWFAKTLVRGQYGLRGSATIKVLASDDGDETRVQAQFVLARCLPVKLKAPSLHAKDGQLAIEEMQIAYESLALENS
jgi:phage tail-like protein